MKVDFEAEKTHPLKTMLPTGIVSFMTRGGFSDRLSRSMDHRGVSQADLARALSTSTTNVSRWTSGERKRVDAETIQAIATVLGCSFEWLSTGKGSPDYDPKWRPPAGVKAKVVLERRSIKSGVMERRPLPPQGAGDVAADDPYPNRAVALKAVGRHFDEAVTDWLRLLSGPEYEAYEVDQWVDELSARQKTVDGWNDALSRRSGGKAS